MSIRDDLDFALQMADAADAVSLARYRAADLVIESKPDLTPVTDADRAVETTLRTLIDEGRPGDAVMGEEFGRSDGPRQWILDPIDGTKNFVRGVPVWATLIALLEGDACTVGVVSAPALGRRWWASAGHGAFTRGPESDAVRPLRVSKVERMGDASLSYSDAVGWGVFRSGLDALMAGTWRQRGYGDFWSHMLVAEGAVDIAAEPQLEVYDLAALVPIVIEAGGHATDFTGRSPLQGGSLLTTNGVLHRDACSILAG